jgi:hypothetical protein
MGSGLDWIKHDMRGFVGMVVYFGLFLKAAKFLTK